MIKLTRLNGNEIVINAEMIKYVEKTPDTILTVRENEKIMIRESVDEVVLKAIEYGRMVRNIPDI